MMIIEPPVLINGQRKYFKGARNLKNATMPTPMGARNFLILPQKLG